MLIDANLGDTSLSDTAAAASEAEAAGLAGVWVTESTGDPFLRAHSALAATERAVVGTAIAVAFARSPMTAAYSAWDLASTSGGRFRLGLGTQVRTHIERRYSMPWSSPVARMRDYIFAMRAIFDTWRDETRLEYDGPIYKHNLMTPAFRPDAHEYDIPISVAAVGPRMTSCAAEISDGIILHPFTNQRYFDEVTLPAISEGLDLAGDKPRHALELYLPVMVVSGDTEQEFEQSMAAVRKQIAFYASTPAYKGVLDVLGCGDLQPRLQELARQDDWEGMALLIDQDLVDAFAVSTLDGDPMETVERRWAARVDRVSAYFGGPQGFANRRPPGDTVSRLPLRCLGPEI